MLATRDPLTGLLVEPVLHEMLAHELASSERYGAPSLVVLDVVGYDAWVLEKGALHADLVVRGLSAMLRSSSRRSDILGVVRPGRLCVVLPRTDHARGLVVARRVRAHCARLGAGDIPLAVGFVYRPTARTVEELLAETDGVMAQAGDARVLRLAEA